MGMGTEGVKGHLDLLLLAEPDRSAVLGVVLSFEWAATVPGTPLWLPYVGFLQIALSLGAAALVARAARLSRT